MQATKPSYNDLYASQGGKCKCVNEACGHSGECDEPLGMGSGLTEAPETNPANIGIAMCESCFQKTDTYARKALAGLV